MQTIVTSDTSSEAIASREDASCGAVRAPSPCLPSNWASMADAASSSGPLPARQRTEASGRNRGASVSCSRAEPSGGGTFGRSRASSCGAAAAPSDFSGGGFPIIVRREFRYQLLDRVLHPLKLFAVQNAALRVLRGELQTSERYLVVIQG